MNFWLRPINTKLENRKYTKNFKIWEGKFKKFVLKSKSILKKLKDLNLIRKEELSISQKGLKILDLIIKKIQKLNGGILLVDYGYTTAAGKDTLQTLKSHKRNIYYENIGQADITYLVNFHLLKKFLFKRQVFPNKIVSQSFFLKKLGIIERAEILSKKMSFNEKSDLFMTWEIVEWKKMGRLFKVLFL